jgi:hypothetical protein
MGFSKVDLDLLTGNAEQRFSAGYLTRLPALTQLPRQVAQDARLNKPLRALIDCRAC